MSGYLKATRSTENNAKDARSQVARQMQAEAVCLLDRVINESVVFAD